ncbi:MAG: PP2C family protein-serine/threonine phosphatase, partial [Actinomycetota bacterium]|nr:PP2C family protein-serine/threonine phosphatase [Actinomycetota bacterium]
RHDQEVSGIIGYHRPIEGVIAGDWWWAGDAGDGVRAFAVADVSGHGVSAGMLALESRTLVTSALMHLQSPEVICSQLASRRHAPGMFLTLFIGILQGGTLTYCSAGHQDAAIVSRHGALELPSTGPIISDLGGYWRLGKVGLAEDSAVLIATDGLLEHAPSASFSLLAQHMWVKSGGQSAECMELLLAQAREQSALWQDDVTVMIATPNR